MQQAAGWRARQEPLCFGLAAPASQAPTSGAVQAQGHSLGARQCLPRPGLCVFKYHVSPKQQSAGFVVSARRSCGSREVPARAPPSGWLRPFCFILNTDLTLEGNERQAFVASLTVWTGRGFKAICFDSLKGVFIDLCLHTTGNEAHY